LLIYAALLCIVVPTIVYVVLLWLVDPYEREPINHVIVLLALGASVAPLLTRLVEAALGLPSSIFPALLERYALTPPSVWSGLIEEASKAVVVLGAFAFLRREFDDTLDGLVFGAVVGAGFALAQALVYVRDLAPAAQIAHVSPSMLLSIFVAGLSQCFFTALFGASLGYMREAAPGRWLIPAAGFAAAALYHMAYTGLGTLADTATAGGVAAAAGIARAIADWVGVILVIVMVRWAWERERYIFSQTLLDETATGAVTPAELAFLTTVHRLGRPVNACLGTGWARYQAARGLHEAQAELAFAKWRRRRGTGTDDDVTSAREEVRRVRGRIGGQPA